MSQLFALHSNSPMNAADMVRKPYSRWQAAGLHLLICAAIATAVITLMLAVWYPRPLFEAEGGPGLVFILVGVDVVIGPLITFVIFKAGKPGLRFDLCIIAVLQLSALAYGVSMVAGVRPAYIVFVHDQFETVGAMELAERDLAAASQPEFRKVPITGPVVVALKLPPLDPQERSDLMFQALGGGKDLRHFPKYYVPYSEYIKEVLARGQTPAQLRERDPPTAKVVDAWLAEARVPESAVLYLPLKASRGFIAALIDAKTGELVKMLLAPLE
jgi:hypothetical protein